MRNRSSNTLWPGVRWWCNAGEIFDGDAKAGLLFAIVFVFIEAIVTGQLCSPDFKTLGISKLPGLSTEKERVSPRFPFGCFWFCSGDSRGEFKEDDILEEVSTLSLQLPPPGFKESSQPLEDATEEMLRDEVHTDTSVVVSICPQAKLKTDWPDPKVQIPDGAVVWIGDGLSFILLLKLECFPVTSASITCTSLAVSSIFSQNVLSMSASLLESKKTCSSLLDLGESEGKSELKQSWSEKSKASRSSPSFLFGRWEMTSLRWVIRIGTKPALSRVSKALL